MNAWGQSRLKRLDQHRFGVGNVEVVAELDLVAGSDRDVVGTFDLKSALRGGRVCVRIGVHVRAAVRVRAAVCVRTAVQRRRGTTTARAGSYREGTPQQDRETKLFHFIFSS